MIKQLNMLVNMCEKSEKYAQNANFHENMSETKRTFFYRNRFSKL